MPLLRAGRRELVFKSVSRERKGKTRKGMFSAPDGSL